MALLAGAVTLSANVVQAAAIFTIEEIVGDVLITGSGSYDLTGGLFSGMARGAGLVHQ